MVSASESVSHAERVLVIGLDGATWTNLGPLAERGELPTLRRLMREGAWGVLESTIPALTPPAWASLCTGTNPGKHGIYHFRHTPPGDYYQRRLNDSRDIHSPTLWQRLNKHAKRVGIINIPLSHPVQPVNGFITNDVFAPDTTKLTTYPSELAQRLPGFILDVTHYPTALPDSAAYRQHMLRFVEENVQVLDCQADAAVQLMKSEDWQFFMVGWMITDRLGHFAWKYSDPALASSLQTDTHKEIGQRVRAAYRRMDEQLARLIETAGSDCTVLIASDHGFGPIPQSFFHTNRFLINRGYLRLLPGWRWRRLVIGNLPRAWKAKLGVPIDSKHGLVDWNGTTAWADPLESRAVGIYINRRDRYPQGIVSDEDYATLRDTLALEIANIQTPDQKMQFAEVHRADQLYHGPHAADGPDLVAILSRDYDVPASFRRDVRSSELIKSNRHVLRDGGHEPEGIYLLWGKNVRPAGQLAPQPILSIVPTVLQLFALPIGEDIDGAPITEAFTEQFLRAYPPRRESEPARPAAASPVSQPEYSAEDSAAVEKRLRQLGYLD